MSVAEVVIGRGAVRWLRALGFEVWQEVQIGQGGLVIDVVGTMGPWVVTVECKATFGLSGKLPGIVIRREGRTPRLYLEG